MSTYVFGDIQGCFDEFQQLLDRIAFDPINDRLWFVGDLINRGPKNLETMQFVLGLTDPIIVLGNHDLHFLAVAQGSGPDSPGDTITDILESSDCAAIINFLRHQKLIHHDSTTGYTLVHAGIPPMWDLRTCLQRAGEVEDVLSGPDYVAFLKEMYGNEPNCWHDNLSGNNRLGLITNYFTRLRYCTADGALELKHKTNVQPKGFEPWFNLLRPEPLKILFGHWAALDGITGQANVLALDTGCVWGRRLTAFHLEDEKTFSVPASKGYQS